MAQWFVWFKENDVCPGSLSRGFSSPPAGPLLGQTREFLGPFKLPAANSRYGSTEGQCASGNLFSTGVCSRSCAGFLWNWMRKNMAGEETNCEKDVKLRNHFVSNRFYVILVKSDGKMRWNLKIRKLSNKNMKIEPKGAKREPKGFSWNPCFLNSPLSNRRHYA